MEIPTVPLTEPLHPCAITGIPLEEVRRATVPIKILISGNHQEEMVFLVMSSPRVPLVLGKPWMRNHNPQVDGTKKSSRAGVLDATLCVCCRLLYHSLRLPQELLHLPMYPQSRLNTTTWEKFLVRAVPHPYLNTGLTIAPSTSFQAPVLSGVVSSPYLHPKDWPWRSTCLAAGLIRSSSSPAGAGFFFVGKKDLSANASITGD